MSDENKETNWRDSLPENLKADPSLSSFKDVAALADSFVRTKALVGSSIRVPGADASAEDRKAFIERLQKASPDLVFAPDNADEAVIEGLYKKLGRPDKAEDYTVDEDTAKVIRLDVMRELAGKTGLTKSQFQKLAKAEAETVKAAQAAHAAGYEALDKEWGAAAKERVQAAAAVAEKLGLPAAVVKGITDRAAPADQVKFLYAVAQAVGGNPREGDRQGDGNKPVAMTPTEAALAIGEIYSNPKHAFFDKNHPNHAAAIKRVLELQGYADPSASKEPPQRA